jgi:NADH-quinone oxidoreductase subunit E
MKTAETIFGRYQEASADDLIPILQDIQAEEGYLSEEAVREVSSFLHLPASRIYGVATFYNQFRFTPMGKNHIAVCRGTACHVLGSATVLEELEKKLKIKAGATSRDGMFSLEVVACIGACGLAPVISINGEFYAKVDRNSIHTIIDDIIAKEEKNENGE